MIDEWCAAAPGRYIPLMLIPLWDPTLRRQGDGALRREGRHAVRVLREPRARSACPRSTTRTLLGSR